MYRNSCVVFCLVVVYCVFFVNGASSQRTNEVRNQPNCSLVRSFFEMRNISITLDEDDHPGEVCGGHCCNPAMETNLRIQVQRDFSNLLRHNSRSLQGLLDTTASTLQDHVLSLTRQSENKTLVIFSQVYRGMAILSQEPIKALYADIRQSVHLNGNQDSFTTSPVDIKSAVVKLFTDLFPLVYHNIIINTQDSTDFAVTFKSCLRDAIHDIQPFGDVPRQISQALSKSLEATRLLLQAFNVGVEVLNTTETLLTDEGNEQECHKALLKMSYCPKCLGLHKDTKPCSGYCLNVLHGCITRHVADLDSAWNGYVEAVERLVIAWKQSNNEAGVNVDEVIRSLDTRISEAIMNAMESPLELEKKVKKACGLPKHSDEKVNEVTTSNPSAPSDKTSKPQRINVSMRDNPPPETQLLHFLTSVAKSKGFYTNLADNLCKDESFAETKDQNCWNGKRIGEYTETVVDPSLGMQRYNPEVNFTSVIQNGDLKIANLADKLRHVHNMVITSLGSVNLPESDSYMQGDAADGSGSGQGGVTDDDDTMPGSGSGAGTPDERGPKNTSNDLDNTINSEGKTSPTSGNTAVSSCLCTTLVLVFIVLHMRRCLD